MLAREMVNIPAETSLSPLPLRLSAVAVEDVEEDEELFNISQSIRRFYYPDFEPSKSQATCKRVARFVEFRWFSS